MNEISATGGASSTPSTLPRLHTSELAVVSQLDFYKKASDQLNGFSDSGGASCSRSIRGKVSKQLKPVLRRKLR
jgi:hypothetical protein